MKKFDAIIVRCNPGQIKQDGGDQQKFDDSMREMRKLGIQVWPSPDVMEKMGAKDVRCKAAKIQTVEKVVESQVVQRQIDVEVIQQVPVEQIVEEIVEVHKTVYPEEVGERQVVLKILRWAFIQQYL